MSDIFPVPKANQTVPLTMADGAEIILRHYPAPESKRPDVRLVASHGNGMAIDLYAPYWQHFIGRFELVVYDFRNHGWNKVHPHRNHGFPFFVWDNQAIHAAIQRQFGARKNIGLFHSMSAITAILQTLTLEACWDGLVLFDPPLTPPPGHPLERRALDNHLKMAERAQRRPDRYTGGFDEFLDRIRNAPQFSRLPPDVLALFAATTFRETPEKDGIQLRCPKELEAYVFATCLDSTFYPRMKQFPTPMLLLGGDPDLPDAEAPSITCRQLAAEWAIPHRSIPDTTHFLQIEAPERAAAETDAFLREQGWC